jgi:hypothetical protein
MSITPTLAAALERWRDTHMKVRSLIGKGKRREFTAARFVDAQACADVMNLLTGPLPDPLSGEIADTPSPTLVPEASPVTASRLATVTCAHCGKPFLARRSDSKTCSAKCRTALHRQRGATPSDGPADQKRELT